MYFVRIFRFQLQLLFVCQPFQPLNHFRLFTNHLFNQLVQTTSSTFFVYLPNSCVQLAYQLLCLCFQKPALFSANNFVSSSFFSTIQPSCHQPSPTTPSILFKPPLNPPTHPTLYGLLSTNSANFFVFFLTQPLHPNSKHLFSAPFTTLLPPTTNLCPSLPYTILQPFSFNNQKQLNPPFLNLFPPFNRFFVFFQPPAIF